MNKQDVLIFGLSGVIGVGKTTTLNGLRETLRNELTSRMPSTQEYELCFVLEPSDLWREMGWLEKFYADPRGNALSFQLLVFDSHVDAIRSAIEGKTKAICLVERTMLDQLLFWKVQVERNTDQGMADDAYVRMWTKWSLLIPPISKIFFCQTSSIQDTMQRVRHRDRKEESVSLEYQEHLLRKHKEWFTAGKTSVPNIETQVDCVHIYLDGQRNIDHIAKSIAQEICIKL